MDTRVQQQVQHWQRIEQETDMNSFIVDSVAERVNPLLGSLDENFEWEESIKLLLSRHRFRTDAEFQSARLPATSCILSVFRYLNLCSAGLPSAVWRASCPPIGPARRRRYISIISMGLTFDRSRFSTYRSTFAGSRRRLALREP